MPYDHKQLLKDHPGKLGVADFRCNACGKVVKRDLGWKKWTKSYCEKTGREVRLYRISAPHNA